MRKIICFLVTGLFPFIFLSGCQFDFNQNQSDAVNNATNKEAIADWLTYENSRYAFSVDYPSDWQLGEAPFNNDGREFSAPDKQITCRAYGFANALMDNQNQAQNLAAYIASLKRQDEAVVLREGEASLGGQTGYELVSRLKDGGAVEDAIYVLGQSSGRGLTCTFPDEETWRLFASDFSKMKTSFRIDGSLDR